MATVTRKTSYGSWVAMTITPASLASDTNLLAGRCGLAIANTTLLAVDYQIAGQFTTGTSPTVSTTIELWLYTDITSAPAYPDTLLGTDANKTLTSGNVKYGALTLLDILTVDATSNRSYPFKVRSLKKLLGIMPEYWGLFVVQNTAAALHATGSNHYVNYRPLYETLS